MIACQDVRADDAPATLSYLLGHCDSFIIRMNAGAERPVTGDRRIGMNEHLSLITFASPFTRCIPAGDPTSAPVQRAFCSVVLLRSEAPIPITKSPRRLHARSYERAQISEELQCRVCIPQISFQIDGGEITALRYCDPRD